MHKELGSDNNEELGPDDNEEQDDKQEIEDDEQEIGDDEQETWEPDGMHDMYDELPDLQGWFSLF
jgi:hypothetical protein